MTRAGTHFSLAACADDITGAVLIGTEERTAAVRPFLLGWFIRIERGGRALWIARDAALFSEPRVIIRPVPIAGPLPDVAGHVVQPIAVRRIPRDRRGLDIAVVCRVRVSHRKPALVGVGHPLAGGAELIAPDERLAAQTAACRELPLCFGRQPFARPRGIRARIVVRDMDDGIVVLAGEVACRAERMLPVGAADVRPPLQMVVERHAMP